MKRKSKNSMKKNKKSALGYLCRRLYEAGMPISQIAAAHDISEVSLRLWRKKETWKEPKETLVKEALSVECDAIIDATDGLIDSLRSRIVLLKRLKKESTIIAESD